MAIGRQPPTERLTFLDDPNRACVNVDPDPDLFFPAHGGDDDGRTAKAFCRACPVVEACREYAIADPSLYGIWGGTSHKQRIQIRRQRARGSP